MAPTLILDLAQNILQPFYHRLLPRIKVNRNIPIALILLLYYMGGFKLHSIKIEQTIEALSLIISYFNSTLPTNDLLKQSLEYLQLKLDLDTLILLDPLKLIHT